MSLSSDRRQKYNEISKYVRDPDLSYDDFSRGYLLKHLCELKRYYKKFEFEMKSIKGKDINDNNINLLQVVGRILSSSPRTTVKISFLVSYPRHPPCVVVDFPKHSIIINTSVLDLSGEVSASLPYLRSWDFRRSNVLSLLLNLDHAISVQNPSLALTFDGVLSKHQAKLARLLVANGRKDLYNKIARLPKDEQKKAFFDAIIARYRPNKDLAEHIETKKDGINGFIKIAEDAAKAFLKLLPASKETVVGGASSSTHGLLPALDYPLDPGHLSRRLFHSLPYDDKDYVKRPLSSLFTHSLTYDDKDCIERHLSELFRDYPDLKAKTRNVDCEGSKVNFIVVEGRILFRSDVEPNVDKGIQIPSDDEDKGVDVTIWLRKSYPVDRPRVYVKCLPDMQIDRYCVNVLPTGAVHFSYLQEWVGDRSSLIGLVSHLSAEFSCQSPNFVYVKSRPISSRDDQGGSRGLLQGSPRKKLNRAGSASCDGKSEYQVPDAGQSLGQGYLDVQDSEGAQYGSSTTESSSVNEQAVDSGNGVHLGSNRSENNFQDIPSQFRDALRLDSHTLNQNPEEANGQVSPCEQSGTGSIVPET